MHKHAHSAAAPALCPRARWRWAPSAGAAAGRAPGCAQTPHLRGRRTWAGRQECAGSDVEQQSRQGSSGESRAPHPLDAHAHVHTRHADVQMPHKRAKEKSRERKSRKLTRVLVVPNQARAALLHERARRALAKVLKHQLHALLPLAAARIHERDPVLHPAGEGGRGQCECPTAWQRQAQRRTLAPGGRMTAPFSAASQMCRSENTSSSRCFSPPEMTWRGGGRWGEMRGSVRGEAAATVRVWVWVGGRGVGAQKVVAAEQQAVAAHHNVHQRVEAERRQARIRGRVDTSQRLQAARGRGRTGTAHAQVPVPVLHTRQPPRAKPRLNLIKVLLGLAGCLHRGSERGIVAQHQQAAARAAVGADRRLQVQLRGLQGGLGQGGAFEAEAVKGSAWSRRGREAGSPAPLAGCCVYAAPPRRACRSAPK